MFVLWNLILRKVHLLDNASDFSVEQVNLKDNERVWENYFSYRFNGSYLFYASIVLFIYFITKLILMNFVFLKYFLSDENINLVYNLFYGTENKPL